MIKQNIRVRDPRGLHAQLAHQLARVSSAFDASVWIRAASGRASLTSPLEVLQLGVPAGEEIEVVADGVDAHAAMAAVLTAIGGGEASS